MVVEGTCSVIFIQGLLVMAGERSVHGLANCRRVTGGVLLEDIPQILEDHWLRASMSIYGARFTSARPEDLKKA